MGRPISKKYFGSTQADAQIKVQFYNGTASVDGWIVKQLGSKKFRCTDGTNTADCVLVDKLAANLLAGEMSISVKDDAGTVHHAVKIAGRKVTANSTSIGWDFSNSTTDGKDEMEEAGGTYGPIIVATSMTNGLVYEIVTVGTSDYTLNGAASNTVGVQFTANNTVNAFNGDGTVKEVIPADTWGT